MRTQTPCTESGRALAAGNNGNVAWKLELCTRVESITSFCMCCAQITWDITCS